MTLPPSRDLAYELGRLSSTLDALGNPTLAEQGAANVWAGTTGLALTRALNVVNGTTDLGLRAVCNAIASTTDEDPAKALSTIADPPN